MEVSEIYSEILKNRDDFDAYNRNLLMEILNDNKDTEFGKKYNFSDISDEKQYQSIVPISTYNDYADYIERLKNGEKNLITAYDTYSLLQTSGSTNKSKGGKLIPITTEALKRYGNVMDRFLVINCEENGNRRFFVSFLQSDLNKDVSSTNGTMLFTAAYYRYNYDKNDFKTDDLIGGRTLNFYPYACDYMYAKLWMAIARENIVSMESVYLYDMLIFFHYFEANYESILKDMENHKVPDEINLPENVKQRLESMEVDPERLKKVWHECKRGFDDIVIKLWPEVKIISGIGSKVFIVEEKSLKKYIGDIPIWHYIYAASECVMAVPADVNTFKYILYPGSAYYEFLSVDTGKITDILDLEIGEKYEIIITTFSGFYRYSIGDVLKVEGFYGKLPIIRFMYRKNLLLNIAGEKLDMYTLEHAVSEWSETRNLSLWQYFFYEDYSTIPARYHGVIVFNDDEENAVSSRENTIFESILKKYSKDYEELRELGSIGKIRLEYVDKDSFLAIQKSWSSGSGQPKPLHIWRQ